jgi:hypothetical protein
MYSTFASPFCALILDTALQGRQQGGSADSAWHCRAKALPLGASAV